MPQDEEKLSPDEASSTYGDDEYDDDDGLIEYRSVSKSAVAALVLTCISVLAFNTPMFVILPLTSFLLGWVARSSIKKYPDELVGKLPATISVVASVVILIGSISTHVYIYMTEVPDGYTRITWKELQPTHPRKPISDRSIELIKQKVFIKGYVYPNEQQTNLEAFVLVRDKGTCCFGGQPKDTDMMYVRLEGDLRINYSWRLRKLGGIFEIDELSTKRVGKLKGIGYYRLTADYLK